MNACQVTISTTLVCLILAYKDWKAEDIPISYTCREWLAVYSNHETSIKRLEFGRLAHSKWKYTVGSDLRGFFFLDCSTAQEKSSSILFLFVFKNNNQSLFPTRPSICSRENSPEVLIHPDKRFRFYYLIWRHIQFSVHMFLLVKLHHNII